MSLLDPPGTPETTLLHFSALFFPTRGCVPPSPRCHASSQSPRPGGSSSDPPVRLEWASFLTSGSGPLPDRRESRVYTTRTPLHPARYHRGGIYSSPWVPPLYPEQAHGYPRTAVRTPISALKHRLSETDVSVSSTFRVTDFPLLLTFCTFCNIWEVSAPRWYSCYASWSTFCNISAQSC